MDFGTSVYIDSSNNIFLTGMLTDTTGKVFTAKLESDGTESWHRLYSAGGIYDAGVDLIVGDSGNVYVVGGTVLLASQVLFLKYNSSGTLQYAHTWHSSYNINDAANKIREDNGNKYLLINGIAQSGTNEYKIFELQVAALDGSYYSSYVSSKSNSLGLIQITNFTLDNSGNSFVCGSIDNSDNGEGDDFFITKLDTALNVTWTQTWSGDEHLNDGCNGIVYDSIHDYIFVCGFETTSTGKHFKIIQLDAADGSLGNHAEYSSSITSDDVPLSIAMDVTGNI